MTELDSALADYTNTRSALNDARQAVSVSKEGRESLARVYEYIADQERANKKRLVSLLCTETLSSDDDDDEHPPPSPPAAKKARVARAVDDGNPLNALADAADDHSLSPSVPSRKCTRCGAKGHLVNTWWCRERVMNSIERARFERSGSKWWGCYSAAGERYSTVFNSRPSLGAWRSKVPRNYESKERAFDTQAEAVRFALTGK